MLKVYERRNATSIQAGVRTDPPDGQRCASMGIGNAARFRLWQERKSELKRQQSSAWNERFGIVTLHEATTAHNTATQRTSRPPVSRNHFTFREADLSQIEEEDEGTEYVTGCVQNQHSCVLRSQL